MSKDVKQFLGLFLYCAVKNTNLNFVESLTNSDAIYQQFRYAINRSWWWTDNGGALIGAYGWTHLTTELLAVHRDRR